MRRSSRVSVCGYWRVSAKGVRHFVHPYSRSRGFRVPEVGDPGTWIEKRSMYLLRWRDATGRKRSIRISAHQVGKVRNV